MAFATSVHFPAQQVPTRVCKRTCFTGVIGTTLVWTRASSMDPVSSTKIEHADMQKKDKICQPCLRRRSDTCCACTCVQLHAELLASHLHAELLASHSPLRCSAKERVIQYSRRTSDADKVRPTQHSTARTTQAHLQTAPTSHQVHASLPMPKWATQLIHYCQVQYTCRAVCGTSRNIAIARPTMRLSIGLVTSTIHPPRYWQIMAPQEGQG